MSNNWKLIEILNMLNTAGFPAVTNAVLYPDGWHCKFREHFEVGFITDHFYIDDAYRTNERLKFLDFESMAEKVRELLTEGAK